mgnify:CR=1 FL=1
MSITKVVAGQNVQTDHYFKPDTGGAYTFVGFVKYVVTDFNDAEVISGAAAQDPYDLARWSVQFALPSNAPIGKPGQRYRLKWIAKVQVNGATETIRETIHFDVVPGDDFSRVDITERIALEKSKFVDRLLLPADITVDSLKVEVLDIGSNVLYEADELDVDPSGTDGVNQWWTHSSPTTLDGLVLANLNAAPIQIVWTYEAGGVEEKVFHYLYLVNAATQRMMLQIRAAIDKARNIPYNPALAWFDTDLLVYIDQGLQQFNSKPPTFTNYGMGNLPSHLQYPVLQCVLWNALRAQLLAENQAQFNFSGQSVTLDVDRQAAIESELGRIQSYIDQEIKSIKRLNTRSIGRVGVIGVNYGPQFNWQPPIYRNPYFLGSMGIPPGQLRL